MHARRHLAPLALLIIAVTGDLLVAQERAGPPGFGPYAAILCHFSDEQPDPEQPLAPWIDLMTGQEEGMGPLFAEISYGQMLWEGSDAFGWFALPHPRSHYDPADPAARFELLDDCFAAADDQVFYPALAGMIVQIAHGYAENFAIGGSGFVYALDGEERVYGIVQLQGRPPTPFLLVHEIGHTMGLLHPGPSPADRNLGPMGAGIGLHYIGPNKAHLGWLSGPRVITPPPAARTTVMLERMALPEGGGPIVARIPSRTDAARSFMVEARLPIGADARIANPAVLVSRADSTAFFRVGPEVVLLWTSKTPFVSKGEYADSVEGMFIEVDSITQRGAGVTITRGWPLELSVEGGGRIEGIGEPCEDDCIRLAGEPGMRVTLTAHAGPDRELERWFGDCSGRASCVVDLTGRRRVGALFLEPLTVTADEVAQALLGGPRLDSSSEQRLDARGNVNGALDLGDLRAWVVGR